jgi:hypothetical protein
MQNYLIYREVVNATRTIKLRLNANRTALNIKPIKKIWVNNKFAFLS